MEIETQITKLQLTEEQLEIIHGQRCPYCKQTSKYMDSKSIYGKSYGMIYACLPCEAWVGCHPGKQTKALGRLANKQLRLLKNEAHRYFDAIWQRRIMKRTAAYTWLSQELGLPKKYTHIGMFSEKTCMKTIEVCKSLLQSLNQEV